MIYSSFIWQNEETVNVMYISVKSVKLFILQSYSQWLIYINLHIMNNEIVQTNIACLLNAGLLSILTEKLT